MKHQRLYSFRWLFFAGASLVALLYYAFFLGPALAEATGVRAFRFMDFVIGFLTFFWTHDDQVLRPNAPMLLGIDLRPDTLWETAWLSVMAIASVPLLLAGAAIAFLWPLVKRDTLPAKRPVATASRLAAAAAWGCLGLAAVCLALGYFDQFDSFEELDYRWMYQTLFYVNDETPLAFALIFALGAAAAYVVLFILQKRATQFWRLERLSFWLLAGSFAAVLCSIFCLVLARGNWDLERAAWNAMFLASSVLLWSCMCRLALLFSFRRFLSAQATHPDMSCVACGYDLRGSLHRPTCPECGTGTFPNSSESAADAKSCV